jgi:hypothetical protein
MLFEGARLAHMRGFENATSSHFGRPAGAQPFMVSGVTA